MTRHVDIKAIVSHIIRGDGADKCRICMGDTSEGQVYLEDTVMMDGERPVTLSELLETITGVEVRMEPEMPPGLCRNCCRSAMDAVKFRTQCQETIRQWHATVDRMEKITKHKTFKNNLVFILQNGSMMSVDDVIKEQVKSTPLKKITNLMNKEDNKVLKKFPDVCCCPDCGKKFISPYFLYTHHKEASHDYRACYMCGETLSKDELLIHINQRHGQNPIVCTICQFIFRTHAEYLKHKQKAHRNGKYSCVECGRTFSSIPACSAHRTVHDQHICPGCSKVFRNRRCYVYHVQKCCDLNKDNTNIHRTKRKIQVEVTSKNNKKVKVGLRGSADKECICDYCGKKFAGKRFVSTHIQIVHLKNTHRLCVHCGKYLAAAHMGEHVKRHTSNLTFTCKYCDLELKTKLGYTQHLRLHTGEKPYSCNYCEETFYASSKRALHIQKVHRNKKALLKYQCSLCAAKFKLPYLLKKHMSSVHDLNNQMEFECLTCHETFSSERGLKHHSRKHQQVLKKNSKSTISVTIN